MPEWHILSKWQTELAVVQKPAGEEWGFSFCRGECGNRRRRPGGLLAVPHPHQIVAPLLSCYTAPSLSINHASFIPKGQESPPTALFLFGFYREAFRNLPRNASHDSTPL